MQNFLHKLAAGIISAITAFSAAFNPVPPVHNNPFNVATSTVSALVGTTTVVFEPSKFQARTTGTKKPTCTISVSPSKITQGDNAVLSWNTMGAEYRRDEINITAYKVAGDKWTPALDGEFTSNGSRVVKATESMRYSLQTYFTDGKPNIYCSTILTVSANPSTAQETTKVGNQAQMTQETYQAMKEAIEQRERYVSDYADKLLACIKRRTDNDSITADAEIERINAEIVQLESEISDGGMTETKKWDSEVKVLSLRRSQLHWEALRMSNQHDATFACTGVSNGPNTALKIASDMATEQRSTFNDSKATYTIRPNGLGGYTISGGSQYWNVEPDGLGGYSAY